MYRVKINKKFNIDEIAEIYRSEKWWDFRKYDKKSFKKMIEGAYAFACLYHNKRIIGVGKVISDGISDAYISDVGLLKNYRGKGLGKKIVKALLDYVLRKGIDWVVLISSPDSVRFYKGQKFCRMSRHVPMKYKR